MIKDLHIVISARIDLQYNNSQSVYILNFTELYIYIFTGIYGGMRCAMQLRAMTGELGCISVSNIFGIPQVNKAIDEDGKPLDDHMAKGLANLMKQLDWNAKAMKYMREKEGIPQ